MTNKEKESILIATKFLAICKGDESKFSFMRNYLHGKIKKILSPRLILPSDLGTI
jgi:hypothetical protein